MHTYYISFDFGKDSEMQAILYGVTSRTVGVILASSVGDNYLRFVCLLVFLYFLSEAVIALV